MQANLETLTELERRLSVTLPAADIAAEVESRLKRLTRTVRMQGFRPGKVPLKVVERQYGPQVRQEVVGDVVEKSFGEAVRQQNLRIAGYPRFEVSPLAEGAADFQYSAIFEVLPEIVVGDLSHAGLSRPQLTVSDAEVDRTLEIMRKQRAHFHAAPRAAQQSDRVTLDYRGTLDGAEFQGSKAENQSVILGEGRMLQDFEAQLTGMSAGETKSFDLRFPDDYQGKEVAGKTAQFEVSVKEVAEPHLPEVDAEFARALGVADGDLGRMRAEVRANLEREVRVRLKNRAKDKVLQGLLDVTKIDAPKGLVQMEVERMQQAALQDLAQRGVKVPQDTPMPADIFQKAAERRVTLGLIMGELMRAHNLQARPEQVKALVEEQAQSYERPEEVVKWYYGSRERLRELEAVAAEENVVEWALGAGGAQEEPVNFDELMGNK